MRMLMRVAIPVDAGNEGIVNGKLMSLARGFIEQHKPEAAYFYADDNGQRCCAMVLDMKDASEIPGLAEPWFQGTNHIPSSNECGGFGCGRPGNRARRKGSQQRQMSRVRPQTFP